MQEQYLEMGMTSVVFYIYERPDGRVTVDV